MENNETEMINKEKASDRIRREKFGYFSPRLIRSVDPGFVLVQRSIFNKNYWKIKEPGIRLNAPWHQARLVDMREAWIDYPDFEFITSDNIKVKVDIAVLVRIADDVRTKAGEDAKKARIENIKLALFENKNVFEHIYFLIKDRLRLVFKSIDSEEAQKLDISNSASANMYPELKSLKDDLNNLKDQYRIEVKGIKNKKVQLPKEVLDVFAQKALNERRKEATEVLAQTKVEVAKRDAEVRKLLAEADAKAYATKMEAEVVARAALVEKLKSAGLSEEKIVAYLNMREAAGSNANITAILGDNTGAASTIAQLGTVYNQVKQSVENGGRQYTK